MEDLLQAHVSTTRKNELLAECAKHIVKSTSQLRSMNLEVYIIAIGLKAQHVLQIGDCYLAKIDDETMMRFTADELMAHVSSIYTNEIWKRFNQ